MLEKGKSYTVKDWFGNKVANEVKHNIMACDLFAILKETEKAVYAMLYIGCGHKKCMWVPKSVLVMNEVGYGDNGFYNHETLFIEDYEKAVEEFKNWWKQYA